MSPEHNGVAPYARKKRRALDSCGSGGDQVALAALVTRRHQGLLRGYLYRLVGGDQQLAEDLVQETLLRVLRQRTYQAGRPFKPWLYQIATNLVRDHFKSAEVRKSRRSGDAEQALLQYRLCHLDQSWSKLDLWHPPRHDYLCDSTWDL